MWRTGGRQPKVYDVRKRNNGTVRATVFKILYAPYTDDRGNVLKTASSADHRCTSAHKAAAIAAKADF
jgi:hypothetical protein